MTKRHTATSDRPASGRWQAAGRLAHRFAHHGAARLIVLAIVLCIAGDLVWFLGFTRSEKDRGGALPLPPDFPAARPPSLEESYPPYLRNPPSTISIDKGRQLFVDDFLIESTTLARTCHQANLFAGNPVLAPDGPPDDRGVAMPYSGGVWFDPLDDRFEMWYYGAMRNSLSFAYSQDGIRWVRPVLEDAVHPGTNVVLDFGGGRDSVSVWLDYEDPDAKRRFKSFSYAGSRRIKMHASPDGIHWEAFGEFLNSISDRSTVFWNPFRQVWVISGRGRTVFPPVENDPRPYARARFYQESPDLVTWRPDDPLKTYWTGADLRDPPYPGGSDARPELYNLDVTPYENLLVGLFSWFYPPPGPDLVEIGLGFSRDGFHWFRPERGGGEAHAFIPAAAKPGVWNAFNTQSATGGFLVVGDELWFYFSGRDQPHSSTDWRGATGLATLRRDGFCSMDADSPGDLRTRPLQFSGDHLFVNADTAGGELRVEALDEEGRPIPPFTLENSVPFHGDSTASPVLWRHAADVSALRDRRVRFRFSLTAGSLYSFWVSEYENGASGGYVAAGGPGFEGPTDTIGTRAVVGGPGL